jgi:hypothetical protein
MATKSRTYIWQFVIGLGFLSGVWTAIGIDPEAVIINALGTAIGTVYPDATVRSLFILLPTCLFLLSVWGAYRKGRLVGIVAVIIAYVAGLTILVSTMSALVLLLAAIGIGWLGTNRRLMKRAGLR